METVVEWTSRAGILKVNDDRGELQLPSNAGWQRHRTGDLPPLRIPPQRGPGINSGPGGRQPRLNQCLQPPPTVTGDVKSGPATHGSFDNNIAVLTETIERIAGAPLAAPMEWLDY